MEKKYYNIIKIVPSDSPYYRGQYQYTIYGTEEDAKKECEVLNRANSNPRYETYFQLIYSYEESIVKDDWLYYGSECINIVHVLR